MLLTSHDMQLYTLFGCPCCRRSRKQQDVDDDEDMQGMPEAAPLAPDTMHTEGIAMDLDAIIAEEELAAQGPLAGKLLPGRCFIAQGCAL